MNKKRLLVIVGISICLILIIAIIAFVCIRNSNANYIDSLSTNEERVRYILTEKGCIDCHSKDPKLPFYASLPIAKTIVEDDIKKGFRYFDMETLINRFDEGTLPTEVELAKLEQSIINESMPPMKFVALHWQSSLSCNQQQIILNWIKDIRAKYYSNGLNAEFFANEPVQALVDSLVVEHQKVALGFKLFHDTRLSHDNTISCATCHDLNGAGIDKLQFSKGIYGQIGGINAPTVYNAAFNHAQFWDGRAKDLQAQAAGPPFDALEMGAISWEDIIAKLSKDKAFTAEFKAVYPDGYSGDNITDAIAEFEKTLLTPNSRFDKYLKGDKNALTEEEIEGYSLFKSNNCATCHVGTILGGQSYEYMGIVDDYLAQREFKDDRDIVKTKDQGHFNASGKESDLQRFKVPTLRNVALTAPYLHDGTALTLEEATRIMLKYQTGKDLSDNQVDKIVKFMNTLTGEYKGEILK